MDALTHAIEGFTSLQANPMSDLVARKALSEEKAGAIYFKENTWHYYPKCSRSE